MSPPRRCRLPLALAFALEAAAWASGATAPGQQDRDGIDVCSEPTPSGRSVIVASGQPVLIQRRMHHFPGGLGASGGMRGPAVHAPGEEPLAASRRPQLLLGGLAGVLRPLWLRLLSAAGAAVLIGLAVWLPLSQAGLGAAARGGATKEWLLRDERVRLQARADELDAQLAELQGTAASAVAGGAPQVLTDEDLRHKVELAQAQAEDAVRRRVIGATQSVIPLAVRAARVNKCLEDEVQSAKARAKELAVERAFFLAEAISDATGVSASPALRWVHDAPGRTAVDRPALPAELVVAGLAAPLQLQVLAVWNRSAALITAALLLVFIWALAFDLERKCGFGEVWPWMLGMTIIMACSVVARLSVSSSAAALMRELETEKAAEHRIARSRIEELQQSLQESSGSFFKAMVGCDTIANSVSASSLNLLNVAHVVWGAVGVAWTVQYVVPDSMECEAWESRLVMHSYSFLYVMLLSLTIPALLLWIAGHVLAYRCVADRLVAVAKQADESYLHGVPLLTWLTRGFMLRRTADAMTGERRDCQTAVDRLSRKRDELEHRTAALAGELRDKRERVRQLERGDGDARREARATAAEAERELQQAARTTVEAALARAREAGVDLELLLRAAQAQDTPAQRLQQVDGTAAGAAAATREAEGR